MSLVRSRAFSLVELLVVVSLIALLMGIFLPALGRARLAAQNQVGQSNQKQIGVAIFAYATNHDGYTPTDSPNLYSHFPSEPLAERAGGWALWNEHENNPRDGNEQGTLPTRYLGLGQLLLEDLVTTEVFFHPVMRDSTLGSLGLHWHYHGNIGRMAGDAGYLPNTTPPGSYPGHVSCNIAYRNSDRSRYVLSEAQTNPDLSLTNNLIESPRFNAQVMIFDTPWDNLGNRTGGTLGYTLGDGSTDTHSIPFFLGSAPRSSSSNADIEIINASGGYLWPATPLHWSSNNNLGHGGPAAGWWAFLIDQNR